MTGSGTKCDNQWQQAIQRVAKNDNEWQQVEQRMEASGATRDEWQRAVTSASCRFFFWVRIEEPTTKQPKEKLLNLEEDLEEDLFI